MERIMTAIPDDVLKTLRTHGQEHLVAWWDRLNDAQRSRLIDQIRGIDFQELKRLFALKHEKSVLPDEHRITPLPRPAEEPGQRQRHRERGEEALRRGAVAFLVVAGGQGSR